MEAWYLACLKAWTHRMNRAPVLHELAHWVKKSTTAVYSAMISLEHKGWVKRVGSRPGNRADRRFEAVE